MNKEDKIKDLERELKVSNTKKDMFSEERKDLLRELIKADENVKDLEDKIDYINKQINKLTGEIMNESRGDDN